MGHVVQHTLIDVYKKYVWGIPLKDDVWGINLKDEQAEMIANAFQKSGKELNQNRKQILII